MSQVSDACRKVYLCDKEGSTYALNRTEYEGKALYHSVNIQNLDKVLTNLKAFKPNNKDVLIIAFPKSGIIF